MSVAGLVNAKAALTNVGSQRYSVRRQLICDLGTNGTLPKAASSARELGSGVVRGESRLQCAATLGVFSLFTGLHTVHRHWIGEVWL